MPRFPRVGCLTKRDEHDVADTLLCKDRKLRLNARPGSLPLRRGIPSATIRDPSPNPSPPSASGVWLVVARPQRPLRFMAEGPLRFKGAGAHCTDGDEWDAGPFETEWCFSLPTWRSIQDSGPGSMAPGLRSPDQACFSLDAAHGHTRPETCWSHTCLTPIEGRDPGGCRTCSRPDEQFLFEDRARHHEPRVDHCPADRRCTGAKPR
jgi:hypothetical protein